MRFRGYWSWEDPGRCPAQRSKVRPVCQGQPLAAASAFLVPFEAQSKGTRRQGSAKSGEGGTITEQESLNLGSNHDQLLDPPWRVSLMILYIAPLLLAVALSIAVTIYLGRGASFLTRTPVISERRRLQTDTTMHLTRIAKRLTLTVYLTRSDKRAF